MSVTIEGPQAGLVYDNNDPLGMRRVRFVIPGLQDDSPHPNWAAPCGAATSSQVRGASLPPPPVGANLVLLFQNNDFYDGQVWYHLGPPGAHPDTGKLLGPRAVAALHEAGQDTRKRTVLYEDNTFWVYVDDKTASKGDDTDDHKIVIAEKTSGSNITLNASDGDSKKAVSINIEARTSLALKSTGIITIDGLTVQIQGRTVIRKPGSTTI